MKRRLIALAAILALLALPVPAPADNPRSARADLVDTKGKQIGTASLTETDHGVTIVVRVTGLPPGPHAIHIHEAAKCEPPDFATAGGHFNPHGKKHGLKNPAGPHAGDLPNLTVGPDGTATAEMTAHGVTLTPGKKESLPGRTSLVIHAGPDDDLTDPAGNSGARIACGVIEAK